MKAIRITAVIASLYLVFQFMRGLFFPVAESPSNAEATLRILFEVGMIVGLVGWLIGQYTTASKSGENISAGAVVLPVLGLLAGLGLLAMQLGGRPQVESPSRPVTPSTAIQPTPIPSPAPAEPAAESRTAFLRAQFIVAVSVHDRLHDVAEKTVWVQRPNTNAFNPAGIGRQDLRDYQQAMRNMITAADEVLIKLNDLAATNVPMPGAARDLWKAKRQIYSGVLQQLDLLEANWSEWSPNGFNEKDPALKPWQRKVVQLQEEQLLNLATDKSLKERLRAEEAAR